MSSHKQDPSDVLRSQRARELAAGLEAASSYSNWKINHYQESGDNLKIQVTNSEHGGWVDIDMKVATLPYVIDAIDRWFNKKGI
jgi:hypothetical protein